MKTHIQILGPDGIPISPEPYKNLRCAIAGIRAFSARYIAVGGYLDARGAVIPPNSIVDYCTVELVPEDPDEPTADDILRELVAAFPELDDEDEPLNGGDAVERITTLREKAQAYLSSHE